MKILALLVFSSLTLSCGSFLLPYNEDPVCRKSDQVGFCGSLSDIYDDMNENPRKYGLGGDFK